ncbi:MAG: hypothetical protein IKC01_08000 [Clostridia bacterium]|nr:hypothetical protein [Clostridia bacterium]
MRSIFRKDIDPQCAYCEHGTTTADTSTVLCKKQGAVMQSFSHCKKFKYDPLKRTPKSVSLVSNYSKEDFSL